MAIARCREHGVNNERSKTAYYKKPFRPTSYPHSGIVCGIPNCRNDGHVWLTEDEVVMFKKGERIFKPASNTGKFQVEGMEND